MDGIIKLKMPERCRTIAVSDVHTNWDLLKKLLDRCGYNPCRDYLIIAGDILERGTSNINTLKYVMNLCSNENAVCLLGNNDTMALRMAERYSYERFSEKMKIKKGNCFEEMAESLGINDFSKKNFENARKAVKNHYNSELKFISGLPRAVETDDFIFVHAGLENRRDWQNTDNNYSATVFRYLREENLTGKWVVCGHFPTYNFKRSNNTVLPIIDYEKKIIDIDGGMGVKSCGQLNALIINKDGRNYSFDIMYEDKHPKAEVLEDIKPDIEYIYCDPYDYSYSVIEVKDGLAKIRIETTGEEGFIPQELIYRKPDGSIQIWDNLSAFPNLSKGSIVRVCGSAGEYSRILTSDCIVGFVKTKFLKMI